MSIEKQVTLGKLIYDEHLRIIRLLNDMSIFLDKLSPFLDSYMETIDIDDDDEDEKFEVPSSKKKGAKSVAYRNGEELLKLFNKYKKRELYEIFLVRAVSAFEDYLSNCLIVFFRKYPKKISTSVQDVKVVKSIDIDLILDSYDYSEIFGKVIQKNMESIFYAEPKKYLEYFEKVLSVEIDNQIKCEFCEIKATRDLIIHNNGLINELYIKKSTECSRGFIGQRIVVNKEYFESAMTSMKTFSGKIRNSVNEKHPIKENKNIKYGV